MLPLNNYKTKYHSLFSTPFERLFTYQLALKGPLCICSDKDALALRVSNGRTKGIQIGLSGTTLERSPVTPLTDIKHQNSQMLAVRKNKTSPADD